MSSTKTKKHIAYPLERINGVLPKLNQADIILVHTKRNFLKYLLQKVTDNYWDHTALVLFTKDPKKGRLYDQIIEAIPPKGIEVHKLEKYLINPDKYDIGIKRVPDLSEHDRENIIAFSLTNVDAPYYKLSRLKFLCAAMSKTYKKWMLRRQRYSCTGFVQKAFYEVASLNKKDRFIFKTDFVSPIELQEITTPADIANSKNCVWIYNEK